jgi:hypothetical protein
MEEQRGAHPAFDDEPAESSEGVLTIIIEGSE